MSNYISVNWEKAMCRNQNTDLYFDLGPSEATLHYPLMRKVCKQCPIFKECAEWSIRYEEYGFWAAMSERERWKARREIGVSLESKSYKSS